MDRAEREKGICVMMLFAETEFAVGYKERNEYGIVVTIETNDSRTLTLMAPANAGDCICDELFLTGLSELAACPEMIENHVPVA